MRRSLPPLELGPCAGGCGPGAGPSPHPPGPRASLALPKLSQAVSHRGAHRWPAGRAAFPVGRPATLAPCVGPCSVTTGLWNSRHHHHHLPQPWLPALGTGSGSEQQHLWLEGHCLMTGSQRGRGRPGLAAGRAAAPSVVLASTYSQDTRGTRDSRVIEGLTSPGTGGIRV